LKTILPKFRLIYLLWLLVPLLLWLALKDINWTEVWAAASRLTGWQLLILAALNLVVIFFFSIGWWLILRAQGHPVPLQTLVIYRMAAFGVSYFTPGPQFGGEPLQVYLLTRNHKIPVVTATAATALDKALELLVNFLVLAAGIILAAQWNALPGQSIFSTVTVLLGLFAALGMLLLASWYGWLPLTRLLRALPVNAPRYHGFVALVQETETQISQFCRAHPKTLLAVILMALICWGFILIEYWLSMYFIGLALTLPQLVTAMTINRIAFLVPLPGGLGALESSQVIAMNLLGLDPAFGITQGLIIRIRDVLIGLVGLAIGWQRSGKKTLPT
jgi:glycosyltransferase 2 family protein